MTEKQVIERRPFTTVQAAKWYLERAKQRKFWCFDEASSTWDWREAKREWGWHKEWNDIDNAICAFMVCHSTCHRLDSENLDYAFWAIMDPTTAGAFSRYVADGRSSLNRNDLQYTGRYLGSGIQLFEHPEFPANTMLVGTGKWPQGPAAYMCAIEITGR